MGKRVNNCPCCGGVTNAPNCCFYSERQDPDTMFVTMPGLGWNKYHHPSTYNPALSPIDRAGFCACNGHCYLDPHFETGATVEVNWINDRRIINPNITCRTELCDINTNRGFEICNCTERIYISDLMIGDVQAARDDIIANEDVVNVNCTNVSAAFIIVRVRRRAMRLPPFNTNPAAPIADGCSVIIETVFFLGKFLNAVVFGPYTLGQDYQSVASMESELQCVYDRYRQALINSCLTLEGNALLASPAVGEIYTDGRPDTCDPGYPKDHQMFGGAVCYGYLPGQNVDPTLPNRFIPLYNFFELQSLSTQQFYGSFCGSTPGFSIVW